MRGTPANGQSAPVATPTLNEWMPALLVLLGFEVRRARLGGNTCCLAQQMLASSDWTIDSGTVDTQSSAGAGEPDLERQGVERAGGSAVCATFRNCAVAIYFY
jgi:hypothetical protein